MTWWFAQILAGARTLVGVAFVLAAVVAATHWAVRAGRIAAFGGWATFVRRWSDPPLTAIERRLAAAGGNPQHAPWWLMGVVVVGGLVVIELLKFVLGLLYQVAWAARAGPGGLLYLVVDLTFSLLIFALIVRILGSWFGAGRFHRYTRWSYRLTDWIVEPLRRVLPTVGMFDLSPLAAWLLLNLARRLLLSL
jgi:YggT family protein